MTTSNNTAANTTAAGRAIPVLFYVVSEKLAWAMRGYGKIAPSQGRLYGTFSTRGRAEEFLEGFPPLQQARMRVVEQ
jgi:hypothetical protein